MGAPDRMATDPVLAIEDLSVTLATRDGRGAIHAVDDVSMSLKRGHALGVIGESGCGKSMTAMAIMRLLPDSATIRSGRILFDGTDLLGLAPEAMRAVRGRRIGMILQDPMVSLDPLFPIGDQIVEALAVHGVGRGEERRDKAIALLRAVGIPAPEQRFDQLPHEMSGGMLQRVVIAIAIACDPTVLIADEPTTALDPTIQRQILDLLAELRRQHQLALILVTHDFGVARATCDDIVVMYAGRIVEAAPARTIFQTPRHPYTRALMESAASRMQNGRLQTIEGQPPDLRLRIEGCAFAPRCPLVEPRCRSARPPMVAGAEGQSVACWVTGGEA